MPEPDKKEFPFTTVTLSSTECLTPTESSPPPPPYRRTWGNDSVHTESKRRGWKSKLGWKSIWSLSIQELWVVTSSAVISYARVALRISVSTLCDTVWPALSSRASLRQLLAFFLVFSCGITPMIVLGFLTSSSENQSGTALFWNVFSDKTLDCGLAFSGTPQNASVSGIEKLFVLDNTFGRFSFSQAKTIDIMWDLFVGRGVQMLAGWVAYNVFCDALLRIIERQPASFRVFQKIALEGPSLYSLWTLMKEAWAANDKRTRALFAYMLIAICYVLTVPIFLGAMTGYDSTNIAWVDLDNTNNIIPASMMQYSWVVTGTLNQTFDRPVCKNSTDQYVAQEKSWERYGKCDCQLANGTIVPAAVVARRRYEYSGDLKCTYDYPGNTQTYVSDSQYLGGYSSTAGSGGETQNCNLTIKVDVDGTLYDYQDLRSTGSFCYDKVAYNSSYLSDKSRCLPDTANPSYKWGFATMMSGIFVFLTFGWCLSMYAMWQDAQFNSTLVKRGYRMTPLRAAFAMAKAAKQKTGMGEKQLIRVNTKSLEKELYGGKETKKTEVEYTMFVEDPEAGDGNMRFLGMQTSRTQHTRGRSRVSLS